MLTLLSSWLVAPVPMVPVHDNGPAGWILLVVFAVILVVGGIVKALRK